VDESVDNGSLSWMKRQRVQSHCFHKIGASVTCQISKYLTGYDFHHFGIINQWFWCLIGGLKNIMSHCVSIKDNIMLRKSSQVVMKLTDGVHRFCKDNCVQKTDFLVYANRVLQQHTLHLIPAMPDDAVIAGGYARVVCLKIFSFFQTCDLSQEYEDIDIWTNSNKSIIVFGEKIQVIPLHLNMNITKSEEVIQVFDWTCVQAAITTQSCIYVTPAFLYSIFQPGAMFAACSYRNPDYKWPCELNEDQISTYNKLGTITHPVSLKINLIQRYEKFLRRRYYDCTVDQDLIRPLLVFAHNCGRLIMNGYGKKPNAFWKPFTND